MNTPKKKVIFFTPGSVGGAERVTLTIAKMLPPTEYEVKVVHICRTISHIDKFIPQRIKTHHIKIRNIWDFTVLKILNFLRKERPYAVFSSLNHLNVRVVLAAKLTGVPKIIIRNNIGWTNWKKINQLLAKNLYRFATTIISQSEEMNNEFASIFRKERSKMVVIPNPIDFETINEKLSDCSNPLDPTKVNYVYVGRIDRVKGLDTLLYAFRQVLDKVPNAFLTIVGDTDQTHGYYEALKNIAAEQNITESIRFVGFQDNPYKYIKNASCFVLPSRVEGNPNVLHEAMWLKIPVVATDSVPIVSQIVSRDRGDVVKVDDVNGLSKAMIDRIHIPICNPYNYSGGNAEFRALFL